MRQKKIKNNTNTHLLFYCILLAWPVLQFCVMYIGVNINSIILSFKKYDATTGEYFFVWFDNFKKVFLDISNLPVYTYGIKNSFIAFFAYVLVGMTLGLLFSYYIYKQQIFSGFFRAMLFAPSIISPIILASLFRIFANSGLTDFVNNVFKAGNLGLLEDKRTAFEMVLIYYIWFTSFGSSTLLYVGAMNGISESVIEAAQLDGAKPMREFISIILPQIYSTISVFLTVAIAGIFTNQLALQSLYGTTASPQIQTIGYYMYNKVLAGEISSYPEVAALGIVITLITGPIVLVARKLLSKFDPMEG